MDNSIYSIIDLDSISTSLRSEIAKTFTDADEDNLDEYITLHQVKDIIIGYSLGNDEEGNYLINQEVFQDAWDDIRDWIFNAGLAKLAAKGMIECAWDDNLNEMVFWRANSDPSNATTNNGFKGGD